GAQPAVTLHERVDRRLGPAHRLVHGWHARARVRGDRRGRRQEQDREPSKMPHRTCERTNSAADWVYAARPVVHTAPPLEAECHARGPRRAIRGRPGPQRQVPQELNDAPGRMQVSTMIGAAALLASGRYAIFHTGIEVGEERWSVEPTGDGGAV